MPSRSIDLVTHAQSSECTRRIDALEEKISENTREINRKISENTREIDRNNRQIAEVLRIVSQIEHRSARGVVNPIFEQDRENIAVGNEDGERTL